jgi:hypothetical protein
VGFKNLIVKMTRGERNKKEERRWRDGGKCVG